MRGEVVEHAPGHGLHEVEEGGEEHDAEGLRGRHALQALLDEAEQQMRNMDKSGRGHLSNETVYKMMQEQMQTQKQLCKCNLIFLFVHVIYDM